jgi:hypothetical protein
MKKYILLFALIFAMSPLIWGQGETQRLSGNVTVNILDSQAAAYYVDTATHQHIYGLKAFYNNMAIGANLFPVITQGSNIGSANSLINLMYVDTVNSNYFIGAFIGNITGTVFGNVTGNIVGDVTGDLNADTAYIDVFGISQSNIIIDYDTIKGNPVFMTELVCVGGFSGNITGNVIGAITGNITGNVTGNIIGNLIGDITGDLNADTAYIDVLGATGSNIVINYDTIKGSPYYAGTFAVTDIVINSSLPAYNFDVYGSALIRDTIHTTWIQSLTSGGTAGLFYLGATTDKIVLIGDTLTDGIAQWSGNLLKGFTSISAITISDGIASINSGAISGVTTLTVNKIEASDSLCLWSFRWSHTNTTPDSLVLIRGADTIEWHPARLTGD